MTRAYAVPLLVLWSLLTAVPPARAAGVDVKAGQATVRVTPVTAGVVRIQISPDGRFSSEPSWALVAGALDHPPPASSRETGRGVEVSTGEVRVLVQRSPLRLTFFDKAGHVLDEDAPEGGVRFRRGGFQVEKVLPEDAHYFGLGEKGGPLDRRGHAYTLWNTDAFGWQESTDPLYKSVPFYLVVRGGAAYGVFLDDPFRSTFDFGVTARDRVVFGAEGGALDYYLIQGPHPRQVIERFTALTGRTPLPPRWALGYQQCRYSYYPEARVREIARTFRQKRIPADVIYLDIDYQDRNRPFTVDRARFPHFDDMISDLGREGFKMIAITDLHLAKAPEYRPYQEGSAGDHFLRNQDGSVYVGEVWPGPSVFPEFTLARSRAWWGTLYRDFVSMGIAGFWNDMNEPAIFQTSSHTMPLEVRHRLDGGRTATHREIHNVYGMLNARATYEGLRKLRPEERPFVLTRAAFAGAQRYAATWTGDNSSTWNHLRLSVSTLVGLGLSGYALVGNDVGGYKGSPSPDLLTRWFELGAFEPVFRGHTEKGTRDQEPWVHGPAHEKIRRRYLELRYRLLPYVYTVMEEASRTGIPLMRPWFLEVPWDRMGDDNARALANDTLFFFGGDLVIVPKLDDGRQPYEGWLPRGTWYDYWSGLPVTVDKAPLTLDPPLETLPIFVRAGAIVPHGPVVQSTAEKPKGPLELRVYPGPDCRGAIYDDDGHGFAYTRGELFRQELRCQASAGAISVDLLAPQGSFQPWWSSIEVSVYGVTRRPQKARVDGKPGPAPRYDPRQRKASVTVPAGRSATKIEVTW